jgi:tetratricopeptide (TPR) repeat protein
MNQEAALAYYMQGTLYSQQGNMSKSLMSYNSALALDSSYSKALFNRSFTWKMMGDFSSAMQDATLIVQIDPESPEYWNLKGNLHLLYADYYEAISCYDRAISLNSEYPEAFFNRGLAHLLSYSPGRGCDDLQVSERLGYKRAEKVINSFCGR